MENPEISSRQIDLEMKFSFLEQHVLEQDREILKLRTQLELLTSDLQRLRSEHMEEGPAIRDNERPPHY